MTKHQIKFYVDDIEKEKLDYLASERHMSINQFAKLSALGVAVSPSPTIEKILLMDILKHYKKDGIFITKGDNKELIQKIEDYLAKSN